MDDLFSLSFVMILAKIVLIDIVLGGDNAVVIALAAGKLPKRQQNTAIVIGTAGAIGIRFIMAWAMIWLLQVPYLHMVGALLLIYIGIHLLKKDDEIEEEEAEEKAPAKDRGLLGAVGTIMAADAVMSLDNVIGIVGVTAGNGWMVLMGMLISVPIIMWGSHFFIRMIEKYPFILYIGGAVLGWAAGGMMAADPSIPALMPYGTALSIGGLLFIPVAGYLLNRFRSASGK